METLTTKQLGDAGEYYALSQFCFAGKAVVKMPDNWPVYDLIITDSDDLLKISVKTRSETVCWKSNSVFTFNGQGECDYLVLILKTKKQSIRSWVIPFEFAKKHAHFPNNRRTHPHDRDIRRSKLEGTDAPFTIFEDNWTLNVKTPAER